MIGTSGWLRFRNFMDATPSSPARSTSRRIKSNLTPSLFSSASVPSLAVRTSYPDSFKNIDAMKRQSFSSSTKRIFLRTANSKMVPRSRQASIVTARIWEAVIRHSDFEHRVGSAEGVFDRSPGFRITDPLPIHDKSIFVAAWRKGNRRFPIPVRLFSQRRSFGLPIIKCAGHPYHSGLGHVQDKLDLLDCSFHWPCGGAGPHMSLLHIYFLLFR